MAGWLLQPPRRLPVPVFPWDEQDPWSQEAPGDAVQGDGALAQMLGGEALDVGTARAMGSSPPGVVQVPRGA